MGVVIFHHSNDVVRGEPGLSRSDTYKTLSKSFPLKVCLICCRSSVDFPHPFRTLIPIGVSFRKSICEVRYKQEKRRGVTASLRRNVLMRLLFVLPYFSSFDG